MEFDDYGTITGYFDVAQAALYLFWLFFAGLIIYLQRENMREGYPLENDDGTRAGNDGPYPLPSPKTFRRPHGQSDVTFPNDLPVDNRPMAMEQMPMSAGSPFNPTGDPMVDGIGPAAWAMREDVPEYDGHGHAKIKPMRLLEDFSIVSWRDCRGLPVQAHDKEVVGRISDVWVDIPEQLVRYLEIELNDGSARLAPVQLVKVKSDRVAVHALYGKHFPGIPTARSDAEITKLEEEKICAYWCGGKLYADPARLESQM